MLEIQRIEELGDELYQALRTGITLAPLTDRVEGITIEDAYHISQRMAARTPESSASL